MDTDGRFARWLRKPAHAGNMWGIILLGPVVAAVFLVGGWLVVQGEPLRNWWIYPLAALVAFLIWRPWIMEALDSRADHWVAARERANERRKAKAAANWYRPEYGGHKPV